MDGRDDARHSPASPLGARIRNRAPAHTAASETGPLQKAEPGWSTRRSLGGRLTDTCRGYVSRDEAEKKRETVGVDSAPGGRLASHRGGAGRVGRGHRGFDPRVFFGSRRRRGPRRDPIMTELGRLRIRQACIVPLAAALLLAACATVPMGPSVMVLPGTGKNFEQFQADDAVCRQWA